ncbi:MAG TPA: GIY-YIG nuclease family protein [Saprospiraceae bacterium]|nr:GIY-YIG nuclease family protein [Saprospiraceae bacterium]
MYFTYVLYSEAHDKIYIGHTQDVDQRMKSHNETGDGYTKRYRPWRLVYSERFSTRAAAMRREKALKGGKGRAWIRANLI